MELGDVVIEALTDSELNDMIGGHIVVLCMCW